MISRSSLVAAALGCLLLPVCVSATPLALDFESYTEGDPVGTPFVGVTFTNATVLMGGSGFNDIDFPPHSGTNSAFDDGGFITVSFATPVFSFSGFFTYITPLTLTAFDAGNAVVDSMPSAFSSNIGSDVGSVPNEFLHVTFAGGISSLTIVGDLSGGSFFVDDVTITPLETTAVPEPGTVALLAGGVAMAIRRRVRRVPVDSDLD